MIRSILSFALLLGLAFPIFGHCDEILLCYNYGCGTRATVVFDELQLSDIQQIFSRVSQAEAERSAISEAIGLFETFSGRQTPTWQDRGGNYADNGVNGRMDCIDHSTNSTSYLKLMADHGWLKFHRVLEPVARTRFLIGYHRSARIAEISSGEEFIVDSWFLDNGMPAVILTYADWRAGGGVATPTN